MDIGRSPSFQRNDNLESLLKKINNILKPAESKVLESFNLPKYPVILVVGNARSGSTLLMQWLARSGIFSYPTNLMSRFYDAPYIGAMIQQMLTEPEFNYKNEILDFNNEISYQSDLGKTAGALSPNGFFYFWRRYFHYPEIQYLNEKSQNEFDIDGFRSEIAAIESVFDKPFSIKGNTINWNIPFLSKIFPKVLFIHTIRHPFYNAQSLIEARIKFFGDINRWYSYKPPEYEFLQHLDPYSQVAGQVYYTNRAIEDGLAQISISKWLKSNYSDFCGSPENLFKRILDNLTEQGFQTTSSKYADFEEFGNTNKIRLSDKECEKIINAYEEFSGITITL